MEDYYRLLGADPEDSQERIKRCFRQRAKELHPDLTVLAEEQAESRMRRLLDAYRVLGDPERRSEYDRLLRPRAAPSPLRLPVVPARRAAPIR